MALMTSRNNSTIITAGEALAQYSFVYCNSSDSKYYLADASNEVTADCVGIVSHTGGIQQDSLGTIQISPCIANNESWNLTKGVTIYLGDSGSLTQTQPTTGIIKPLGFAVTEHQISFNPNLGWYAEETPTPETIESYFDNDVTLAGNDDNKVATQRATKTYVDTGLSSKASTSYVDAFTVTSRNVANGYAGLGTDAKLLSSVLPSSITGYLTYKGVWSAAGGTYPSNPTSGWFYVVSVTGTISGTAYAVNDWMIYNGSSWDKIANSSLGSHELAHLSGGTDEIDGDKLDIDYVPSSYTRSLASGYSTTTGHLSSHLKGIDQSIARLKNYYNVLDYGAVISDSVDSSEAILNLISTLPNLNEPSDVSHDSLVHPVIFFPPGIYVITKTIDLTLSAACIEGTPNTTIYFQPKDSNTVILFKNGSVANLNISAVFDDRPKVIISLLDMFSSIIKIENIAMFVSGIGYRNPTSPSSIGIQLKSGHMIHLKCCQITADIPISLEAGILLGPGQGGDHYHFTDINLKGIDLTTPAISVAPDILVQSLTIDGDFSISDGHGAIGNPGNIGDASRATGFNNLTVSNMRSEGDEGWIPGVNSPTIGIHCSNILFGSFRNCQIMNSIQLRGCEYVTFENCNIYSGTGESTLDIDTSCNHIMVLNCRFQSPVISGGLPEVLGFNNTQLALYQQPGGY